MPKLNTRKTLMKVLGEAGLRDFKSNEEIRLGMDLIKLMSKNDQWSASGQGDTTETFKAGTGPTTDAE